MHVSLTPSTAPMLLLALYLWHRAKGQFLPVAMFMSIFQAASVLDLNLGGLAIGVQPTYIILILALASKFTRRRPPTDRLWRPAQITTVLLGGFVAYATVSALVHPFLFAGVLISNPRMGFNVPLKWELGHLNQLFYLLLSFAIYLVAAYWTTPAELTKSLYWFMGGAVFASLIGFYQYVATKTGLPFPREILDTSPTYSIFKAYEIDGFPRMNATFTEAAAAAFSMTVGLAIALWRFLSRSDSFRGIAAVLVIGMGLLLTISTTGYLCLTFLLLVTASRYFAPQKGTLDSHHTRVLLVIPVCLFLFTMLAVGPIRDSVVRLGHTVLFDKTTTSSFQERTVWNQNAFNAAADTFWLGAGWGVCRASSFIPTLFGNVGLPGAALFFALCANLLWPAFSPRKLKVPIHGAVLFGLSAVLLDLSVSAPEIAHPIIWLLFAMAAKFASGQHASLARLRPPQHDLRSFHATA